MGNLMFKFASLMLSNDVADLSGPVKSSLFANFGQTILNAITWLLEGAMLFIYWVAKFILNIVDFLQYFCQKLVGLDVWSKDDLTLSDLNDSDLIFRFLRDDAVIKVFKYMLGIFFVLLIVFTIIAIIKNEYAYVTAGDMTKASNNKMDVIKHTFKALMLVFLIPVLIIFGVLASNAVLASIINAINGTKTTFGGQIFSASAYNANKYRLYANSGVRIAATNNVMVDPDDPDTLVSTGLTRVNPKEYGTNNLFTGFMFELDGEEYLYYVEKSDDSEQVYNYLLNVLDADLVYPGDVNYGSWGYAGGGGGGKGIRVDLHRQEGDSSVNQAAYNTWIFNEYLTRTEKYENTITYSTAKNFTDFGLTDEGVIDECRIYQNKDWWAQLHDGGKNGLVALKSEYLANADVIDFMIKCNADLEIVNIKKTNFAYLGNVGLGTDYYNASNDCFRVDYKDEGNALYTPENTSSEEMGAIYVYAYKVPTAVDPTSGNVTSWGYMPLVNGSNYMPKVRKNKDTNRYEIKHETTNKFKSAAIKDGVKCLIVARGVLDSTFNELVGRPTQIYDEPGSVGTERTIRYEREEVSGGNFVWDFSFNLFSLFGGGTFFRFNLAFASAYSEVRTNKLSYYADDGTLSIDYNFYSDYNPNMSVQTFYVTSQINPIVLLFASILTMLVLTQSVWGLIARIYDIVLYFLVMPGVVSATPLKKGQDMFGKWQSGLIKKVFGAYGVLIGLNLFFVLMAPLNDISQLFTQEELNREISKGSWLYNFDVNAINNLVYILFMLVALTLIKTLPKTISDMLDFGNVYADGEVVKKNVSDTVTEVGRHLSGQAAVDTVHKYIGQKDEKTGKFKFGALKNFVPGSAIWDNWKKNHPSKKKGEKDQENANEKARQEAEARMNQANQTFNNAHNNQNPQGGQNNIQQTDVVKEAEHAKEAEKSNESTVALNAKETEKSVLATDSEKSALAAEATLAQRALVADRLADDAEPKEEEAQDADKNYEFTYKNNSGRENKFVADATTIESLDAIIDANKGKSNGEILEALKNSDAATGLVLEGGKAGEKIFATGAYQAIIDSYNDRHKAETTEAEKAQETQTAENAQVSEEAKTAEEAKTSEEAQTAENADKSETSKSDKTAQTATGESGAGAAKAYAESARGYAEAAKIYADLAGNRIKPVSSGKIKKNGTLRKLQKLESKREKRLQKQEAGKAGTNIWSKAELKKAYKQFNKENNNAVLTKEDKRVVDKAIEKHNKKGEKILDKSDAKAYATAAEKYYKQKHNGELDPKKALKEFDKHQATLKAKALKEFGDAAYNDIKEELAKEQWAEKHPNDNATVDTMIKAFEQDQENMMAKARNNFINDKIDMKIAKQNERVARRGNSGFAMYLAKTLGGKAVGLISHKTTFKEKAKLANKLEKDKDAAQKTKERIAEMRAMAQKVTGAEKEKFNKQRLAEVKKLNKLKASIAKTSNRLMEDKKGVLHSFVNTVDGIYRFTSVKADKLRKFTLKKLENQLEKNQNLTNGLGLTKGQTNSWARRVNQSTRLELAMRKAQDAGDAARAERIRQKLDKQYAKQEAILGKYKNMNASFLNRNENRLARLQIIRKKEEKERVMRAYDKAILNGATAENTKGYVEKLKSLDAEIAGLNGKTTPRFAKFKNFKQNLMGNVSKVTKWKDMKLQNIKNRYDNSWVGKHAKIAVEEFKRSAAFKALTSMVDKEKRNIESKVNTAKSTLKKIDERLKRSENAKQFLASKAEVRASRSRDGQKISESDINRVVNKLKSQQYIKKVAEQLLKYNKASARSVVDSKSVREAVQKALNSARIEEQKLKEQIKRAIDAKEKKSIQKQRNDLRQMIKELEETTMIDVMDEEINPEQKAEDQRPDTTQADNASAQENKNRFEAASRQAKASEMYQDRTEESSGGADSSSSIAGLSSDTGTNSATPSGSNTNDIDKVKSELDRLKLILERTGLDKDQLKRLNELEKQYKKLSGRKK